jgi:hypothetical protein
MEKKNRRTQKERLLELLKEKKGLGIYVYEIMMPRPQGLGIAQYGARILELRREGHNIKNTKPGHFILIKADPEQANFLQ